MRYDVAVVGLGGMGSATVAECAARGASVIGLEQFVRGHDLGASSGQSRLIRKAYFEDPAYVPLLHRAFELWRKLERESDERLLSVTGVLSVGEENSAIIRGTQRAAIEHDLPLERWSRRDVRVRYPTLQMLASEVALFEPDAGVVKPERAIAAQLARAAAAGAEMRFGAEMASWRPAGDGVEILLTDGDVVQARSLTLTLGPWFKNALTALGVRIRVQRNVQAWFSSATNDYVAHGFPCFLLNRRRLPAPLYGFPDFGDGVKAAFHGFGELTEPEQLDRTIDFSRDIEPLAAVLEAWMPGATTTFRAAKPCMYSLTPDEHFVVDRHPEHANVVLCGGFSGHGFKFAPVIGEIAAGLALDGKTEHEIGFLSLRRFTG